MNAISQIDPTIQLVNVIATIPYFVLIVAIALRQLDRIIRHRVFGTEPPELLRRDAILFWALVIIIAVPSAFAAIGIRLGDYLWWAVFRTIVGLIVLGIWAWYEYVRIGRDSN